MINIKKSSLIVAKALPVLNTQIISSQISTNSFEDKNISNKIENKVPISKSIMLGLRKGYYTPTLPAYILAIHNHVFVRMFRILGGISMIVCFYSYQVITVTGNVSYYFIFFYIINIIFFIYNVYLTYHRFKHIRKLLKGNELEIRNSPLNLLATKLTRLTLCLKGACDTGIGASGLLSLGMIYDAMLVANGQEPAFVNFLSQHLLPRNPNSILNLHKEILESLNKMKTLGQETSFLEEALKKIDEIEMDEEFKNDLKNGINETKELNKDDQSELVKLIKKKPR